MFLLLSMIRRLELFAMLFESTKQITGYHLSRSTFYVVAFYHVNQLPVLEQRH